MRKVSEDQALSLIRKEKDIRCKISSRDFLSVKTETDLKNLIDLKNQGVQMAEFYEFSGSLPENAIEISLDDAMKIVSKGKIVYGFEEGEEAEEICTVNSLITFYRSAALRGQPILYWLF